MDLSTTYLGLKLCNPFVAGASPLTQGVEKAERLEAAGAAAVVMPSLFEEQSLRELERVRRDVERPAESFAEALTYLPLVDRLKIRVGPDDYLEEVRRLKAALGIPVIASLNGATAAGWVDLARAIEAAGADAVEINVYYLPSDPEETGEHVEARTAQAVAEVRAAVKLPVAVKLSPFFSSLPAFVRRLSQVGADGVVLFNRFYQPDIDIENLEVVPRLHLSDSSELLLRLRWLAILAGRVNLSLAVTGGVHSPSDAVKALMAGADAVQLVSALLRHGAERLAELRREVSAWMEAHDYDSVEQMRGSMSHRHCPDPSAVERVNYLKVIHGLA